jgi:hypothetical protein
MRLASRAALAFALALPLAVARAEVAPKATSSTGAAPATKAPEARAADRTPRARAAAAAGTPRDRSGAAAATWLASQPSKTPAAKPLPWTEGASSTSDADEPAEVVRTGRCGG